jgi:hypothetical protein
MKNHSKICKINAFHAFKSFRLRIIFSTILSIGCVYQTYCIFHLYFSYPTIVSTETQLVNYDRELPAITFCVSFDGMKKGLTLNKSFDSIYAKTLITGAFIRKDGEIFHNITEDIQNSIITVINSRYYCQTINSQMEGTIWRIRVFL